MLQAYSLRLLSSAPADQAKESTMGLLDQAISWLLGEVLPVVLSNDILLGAIILLLLALVAEIISGFLDFVVYTALAGGLLLLVGGTIVYITA